MFVGESLYTIGDDRFDDGCRIDVREFCTDSSGKECVVFQSAFMPSVRSIPLDHLTHDDPTRDDSYSQLMNDAKCGMSLQEFIKRAIAIVKRERI